MPDLAGIKRYYPAENFKLSSASKCLPSLSSALVFGRGPNSGKGDVVCPFTLLAFCFLLPQLVLARIPGATPNKLLEYLLKAWKK